LVRNLSLFTTEDAYLVRPAAPSVSPFQNHSRPLQFYGINDSLPKRHVEASECLEGKLRWQGGVEYTRVDGVLDEREIL